MSRKNQIIKAVGNETSETQPQSKAQAPSAAQTEAVLDAEAPLFQLDEAYESEEPRSSAMGWIASGLAVLAIIGWSALYGWAMQDQLLAAASAAPTQWVRWIIDWSVPVLLI
ncbi:MAG: hypothetical protein AAFY81_01670, partial [Pseudomonadota bacterium]